MTVRTFLADLLTQLVLFAELFGLPVLFVVFVLKGMLIGKPLSTTLFLPGYIIATRADMTETVLTVLVVTLGYIIGQLVIYVGVDRYGLRFIERLPYVNFDPTSERTQQVLRWFDTYGGLAVFVSNCVPFFRGLLTIPAATSDYPLGWYVGYMGSSSLLYFSAYVALALAGVQLVL